VREALSSERGGRSRLLESMDSVDAWEPGSGTAEAATSDPTPTKDEPDPASDTPPQRSGTGFLLEAVTGSAVVLCLAASLLHVLLVFLHVAPPNVVSERYSTQINGWIYPLFEQSWRLFAPDPESVTRQISARTMHTSPDGTQQVSDWFDLTAVDESAVEHNFFPSHTVQNMLRRAWTSYLELHGSDDRSNSERALMVQKYLRNIAADRVAGHRGGAFEAIQLQVITRPIAAPGAGSSADGAAPVPPVETRYLPWWKTGSDEN
jgi:Family of unknown function (DUF5819)